MHINCRNALSFWHQLLQYQTACVCFHIQLFDEVKEGRVSIISLTSVAMFKHGYMSVFLNSRIKFLAACCSSAEPLIECCLQEMELIFPYYLLVANSSMFRFSWCFSKPKEADKALKMSQFL